VVVQFSSIPALEILDPCSQPNLAVSATLSKRRRVRPGALFGSAVGGREAVELGDRGRRYASLGARRATAHVSALTPGSPVCPRRSVAAGVYRQLPSAFADRNLGTGAGGSRGTGLRESALRTGAPSTNIKDAGQLPLVVAESLMSPTQTDLSRVTRGLMVAQHRP